MHLFWTENWKRTDQRYIGTRLERLVQTLGIQNATANSIRHGSSTELAAQEFDGRTINIFEHNISYSKIIHEFYFFVANREQDSLLLVNSHGEKQDTQIISKLCGGQRVNEEDALQLSVEAEFPISHKNVKRQKSLIWGDYQDVEQEDEALNSNMTKNSYRATTAEAQK
ncbi:MAG: hypothetical protein EZS28_029929 [Streblomastix strix]|uniref:Uncharacterized protein n=1 Tax=Streblomastix strix TaxID=222440 RepID=A0A5J4UXS6_9EUKA|nr:MAG: hypothetical protein EZS28_029929 [Streblomastix strix]